MSDEILKLANAADVYNFHKGPSFILDEGTWRLERRRDRLRFWLRRKLRLGVWQRCVEVDPARGLVTFATMRWSWLRWRWERV